MKNTQLAVNAVDIGYAQQTIVHQLSFSLIAGDIACLLGPSGCGKSTLLRAIAGFEPVRQGEIVLNGRKVSRTGATVAPEKRKVGMVFQDFALFPHLNVAQNVAFGLRGWEKNARQQRVVRLLELVELSEWQHAYPHQLSGGQQQRIALIRALAPQPDVLLLDEPFSSMDVELREQLAFDVRQLLKAEGVTAMMVTHDQVEAFAFADWVGVMQNGRLLQWATPYALYHQPSNRFVAEFIGQGTLLPAQVHGENRIHTDFGILNAQLPAHTSVGDTVHLLLRRDDVTCDEASQVKGVVIERRFHGATYSYTLRLASGHQVLCDAPSQQEAYAVDELIGIRLEMKNLVVFAGVN